MTTVLVVDDEPDIALICRLALSFAGFTVDERDTGAAALDYIAATPPDVVLLDLRLPDLTGWEVVERLRDSGRLDGVNVVMFSAEPRGDRLPADAGFVGFLAKPFTPDELVAAVRAAAANKTADSAGVGDGPA